MHKSKLFFAEHRDFQNQFGTRQLADKQEETIVHDTFSPEEIEFINGRDMFFLSTLNSKFEPTVSYKGGPVGFIQVENNQLVFPNYDGNGMFLSMGNLIKHNKVGVLFVDFETPRRLRVQGRATIDMGSDKKRFPGAQFLIRITPTAIWVNCPRYIHTYKRVSYSKYTPADNSIPPIANWKRLDFIQNSLPDAEKLRAMKSGIITLDEYKQLIINKDG